MIVHYPATYRDEFGEEKVIIQNDGKILSFALRGIEFKGKNFHSFRISDETHQSESHSFNLYLGELCGYAIDCDIPVWLVSNTEVVKMHLRVHVEYGKPDESSSVNYEVLQLTFEHHGQLYQSGGKNLYGTFDEQLTELNDALPTSMYLKVCWNCAFSDYYPSGSAMFGELACFRNTKDKYRQVKSKIELIQLWDKRAEDVQEIYLCPEFEKHQPNIGGRYVGHGNIQSSA